MMRTQPPGFRWLVGGFALLAAVAFGFRYRSTDEPTDLILGVLCLVTAGYWLIFDREPAAAEPTEDSTAGVAGEGADDALGRDALGRDALDRDALGRDALGDQDAVADQRPDRRHPG
jgi:hypothetical protein